MDYLVMPLAVTLIICLVLTIKVWVLERRLNMLKDLFADILRITGSVLEDIGNSTRKEEEK